MALINFVWQLPSAVFWLWLSGVIFFAMTIVFFFSNFRRDKSELMQGFLGFLGGMAWFHLFLGGGMYWQNITLNILAVFGAVTGSAYLLKFPLLSFQSEAARKNIFYLTLTVGWLAVLWMLLYPPRPELPMIFGSLYMIVISGAISGFYFVWKGLHYQDPILKIKCIGGGCSIIACCFLTHIIVLTVGMTILAKTFMVLAPLALIFALYIARRFEWRRQSSQIPVTKFS